VLFGRRDGQRERAVNAYRWETSGVVATRWRLIAKTINLKSGLFL